MVFLCYIHALQMNMKKLLTEDSKIAINKNIF